MPSLKQESTIPFFTLEEIKDWQLNPSSNSVELPTLQRGFVWKTNQIEAVWDSVLRGFPIGAFLLSKTEDDKLFLMDGQQRATSTALGFYNPWDTTNKKKFWSIKNSIPIVWVDLAPSQKTDTQKFVIRVVTRSHPWGYQRKENSTILSVNDRRTALDIFYKNKEVKENKSYTDLLSTDIYPYDANLPVPLSFLIASVFDNMESKEDCKKCLIGLCETYLPKTLQTKHTDVSAYTEGLKDLDITPFFEAVKQLKNVQIPGIIVEKEVLQEDEDENLDDPTLFVRLNSSGTKIEGNELMYSIYKASFPEAKDLVESIGLSFVAPPLVISLVARLALSEINKNQFQRAINITQFRKRIKEQDFKDKMQKMIGNKDNIGTIIPVFIMAIKALNSENNVNLPPVLIKNIIKSSPDLFLMLLQWIKLNNINDISTNEEKNIIGVITAVAWFGEKDKFAQKIWNDLESKDIWISDVVASEFKINEYFKLIKPADIEKYLLSKVVEEKKDWWNGDIDFTNVLKDNDLLFEKIYLKTPIEAVNNVTIQEVYCHFMNKLLWNKAFVLFAQRAYINERFKDFNQIEDLEDTNSPWDWDHIYSKSYVNGPHWINQQVKNWNNTIGNFRAMSLEENRSENNSLLPHERLNDSQIRTDFFIKENDWKHWQQITVNRIYDANEEQKNAYLTANILRLCNIYKEWYDTLNIDEIFNKEKN